MLKVRLITQTELAPWFSNPGGEVRSSCLRLSEHFLIFQRAENLACQLDAA